jgi:HAD superfamily hydrolase (TIGR01509 family)
MIQTVIFDLDGVIIDSEPIHFRLEEELFKELGISVSFEEHNSYVGTSSINMWQAIVKKHALKYKPGELEELGRDRYLNYLAGQSKLIPIDGVCELITELHQQQFKLVLASSSSTVIIDPVLNAFDLASYFMAKISGADLPFSKPHPEIFLRSALLARTDCSQCLVIEDSENGVKAAKAAGMKCIGYLNPNSGRQNLDKADLVISSFHEININAIRNI